MKIIISGRNSSIESYCVQAVYRKINGHAHDVAPYRRFCKCNGTFESSAVGVEEVGSRTFQAGCTGICARNGNRLPRCVESVRRSGCGSLYNALLLYSPIADVVSERYSGRCKAKAERGRFLRSDFHVNVFGPVLGDDL